MSNPRLPKKTPRLAPAARSKYKLDAQAVAEIRRRRAEGETIMRIARDFGVYHTTVSYWTTGAGSAYDPLPWVTRRAAA